MQCLMRLRGATARTEPAFRPHQRLNLRRADSSSRKRLNNSISEIVSRRFLQVLGVSCGLGRVSSLAPVATEFLAHRPCVSGLSAIPQHIGLAGVGNSCAAGPPAEAAKSLEGGAAAPGWLSVQLKLRVGRETVCPREIFFGVDVKERVD